MVGDPAGAQAPGFDDGAWKPVTLPRAWNEDDAYARDIVDHSTGIAWYRKRFTIKDHKPGQKVFIEFEGARQAAEVFVNGRRVGLHENGVTAFGFDIGAALVAGENVVAVRTWQRCGRCATATTHMGGAPLAAARCWAGRCKTWPSMAAKCYI